MHSVSLRIRYAIADEDIQRMQLQLYDRLMANIIDSANRLDLSYRELSVESEDNAGTGQTWANGMHSESHAQGAQGAMCVRPKDFELFLNLVSFCEGTLDKLHGSHFKRSVQRRSCCYSPHGSHAIPVQTLMCRWAYLFCKMIIVRSYDLPLVSGFYKLLTYALKTCEKERLLDDRDTSRRGLSMTQNMTQKQPPCVDEDTAAVEESFAVGDSVQYLSSTHNTWIAAVVKELAEDGRRVHLDVKKSTPSPH